jgi:hypothetical protein
VRQEMKILFDPRPYKIVKGIMLLIAVILVAYVAYAATTLSVSNTGTITAGQKNFALAVPTCAAGGASSGGATPLCEFSSQPACGATSGTYNTATSTYTIADWTVAQQAGTQTKFVCLENTGVPTTATVSWAAGALTPAGLTCSSTTTAKPIANNAFLAVDLTCATTTAASSGTGLDFGTFTVS